MKQITFSILLTTLFCAPASMADPMLCKKIDFDSYFIAQNAKSSLQKANPDLTHANFAHKYLLLKDEMMMETLYLIADCETGKFFHEKLKGSVEFTLQSNEVKVKEPKEDVVTQIWNGSHWLKVETPLAKTPSTEVTVSVTNSKATNATVTTPVTPAGPPAKVDILSSYDSLFKNYPVSASLTSCHTPDFDSSFRAQNSKGTIIKNNGDLTKPNFAGNYLLLKDELMFDTLYLLVDCKTGKFIGEPLKDDAKFRPDSSFVLIQDSNHYPRLYVLHQEQWIQIPDPVQNKAAMIKNTLYHEDAEALFNALPNPKHLQIVRFENLEKKPETEAIFKILGVSKISAGKCVQNQKSITCEVQTNL